MIKRAVLRALTRFRVAKIKELDTIARLETPAIACTPLSWRGLVGTCSLWLLRHRLVEGYTYISGSSQNQCRSRRKHNVFIASDGFKPGETKTKSALIQLFVGANIRPATAATQLAPHSSQHCCRIRDPVPPRIDKLDHCIVVKHHPMSAI